MTIKYSQDGFAEELMADHMGQDSSMPLAHNGRILLELFAKKMKRVKTNSNVCAIAWFRLCRHGFNLKLLLIWILNYQKVISCCWLIESLFLIRSTFWWREFETFVSCRVDNNIRSWQNINWVCIVTVSRLFFYTSNLFLPKIHYNKEYHARD